MRFTVPACVVSYSRLTGEVRFLTPFNDVSTITAYVDMDASPSLVSGLDNALAFGGYVSLTLHDLGSRYDVISVSRDVY